MRAKIERTIRESPLFKHLSDPRRQQVVEISGLDQFGRGDTIIEEDTAVDRLYIVLTGRVRVWTTGPRGDVELKTLGPGAYFGEVSVMSGKDATATVEVKTPPVECVTIPREHLQELVETDETIRKMLQGVTIARARDTIGKVFN